MSDRIEGYAAAALELARAEGELDRVERELYSIARTFETSTELRDALSDPRLPAERKASILEELLGGRASELTVSFLGLLVDQGRIADLPAIADALAARAAATRQREVAEVRTAVPLDEDTLERITRTLEKATGRSLELRTVVDPAILGGIVARIGDTVIDGSVRRRLESLRETLQARS